MPHHFPTTCTTLSYKYKIPTFFAPVQKFSSAQSHVPHLLSPQSPSPWATFPYLPGTTAGSQIQSRVLELNQSPCGTSSQVMASPQCLSLLTYFHLLERHYDMGTNGDLEEEVRRKYGDRQRQQAGLGQANTRRQQLYLGAPHG